jgi:hypothetical protein
LRSECVPRSVSSLDSSGEFRSDSASCGLRILARIHPAREQSLIQTGIPAAVNALLETAVSIQTRVPVLFSIETRVHIRVGNLGSVSKVDSSGGFSSQSRLAFAFALGISFRFRNGFERRILLSIEIRVHIRVGNLVSVSKLDSSGGFSSQSRLAFAFAFALEISVPFQVLIRTVGFHLHRDSHSRWKSPFVSVSNKYFASSPHFRSQTHYTARNTSLLTRLPHPNTHSLTRRPREC